MQSCCLAENLIAEFQRHLFIQAVGKIPLDGLRHELGFHCRSYMSKNTPFLEFAGKTVEELSNLEGDQFLKFNQLEMFGSLGNRLISMLHLEEVVLKSASMMRLYDVGKHVDQSIIGEIIVVINLHTESYDLKLDFSNVAHYQLATKQTFTVKYDYLYVNLIIIYCILGRSRFTYFEDYHEQLNIWSKTFKIPEQSRVLVSASKNAKKNLPRRQ